MIMKKNDNKFHIKEYTYIYRKRDIIIIGKIENGNRTVE